MRIDDLSSLVYAPQLHQGVTTRAVGWLGSVVPTSGKVSPQVLKHLLWLRENEVHHDGDLGYHKCEICFDYEDAGELWLESEGIRYVAPAMILHYCKEHLYLPPEEFLNAMLKDCS